MSINPKNEPNNTLGRLLSKRTEDRLSLYDTPDLVLTSATTGQDVVQDLREWAFTSAYFSGLEEAQYQHRHGSHRLILGNRDLTARQVAAVKHAEAEFALVVEKPLIVLGARFGSHPWVWTAPYNWHFAPPAERVVPARLPLTPETFSRLWSSLRIAIVDPATRRTHTRRAVALRPEFTHALHAALREQALRPFHVEAADRALDRLKFSSESLESRIRVRSRSAAVTDHGDGWSMDRTTAPATVRNLLLRQSHG